MNQPKPKPNRRRASKRAPNRSAARAGSRRSRSRSAAPGGGARPSRPGRRQRNKRVSEQAAVRRRRSHVSKSPRWERWRQHIRRHGLRLALVCLGLLLGVGGTLFIGYGWFSARRAPAKAKGAAVAVNWPPALDAAQAAELLRDLGLTDSRASMALYLRSTGAAACFRPGPHLLPVGATPRELVAALCRSAARPVVKLSVPEGLHRFSIAKRVEALKIASADAFVHATNDGDALYAQGIEPGSSPLPISAEGYLFPATYEFSIDSEPAEVVKRMIAEGTLRFSRLSQQHAGNWERLQAERSFGRREVMILASMIEKEAVVAEERPVIASVFLNRLSDPAFKYLQSDPTAMYGCQVLGAAVPACANYDGKASRAINRDPANLYSTYVTRGLPPGPICNPGAASVEAVLAPAATEYRFFVAKGGGRHTFTNDYAAHKQAIEALRQKHR